LEPGIFAEVGKTGDEGGGIFLKSERFSATSCSGGSQGDQIARIFILLGDTVGSFFEN
jgi:hypothetical protein